MEKSIWDEYPLMIRCLVPTTELIHDDAGMRIIPLPEEKVFDLVRRKYSVNREEK